MPAVLTASLLDTPALSSFLRVVGPVWGWVLKLGTLPRACA